MEDRETIYIYRPSENTYYKANLTEDEVDDVLEKKMINNENCEEIEKKEMRDIMYYNGKDF